MQSRIGGAVLLALMLACGHRLAGGAGTTEPRYKVGDRLHAEQLRASPEQRFRSITWDELMPRTWNPMAALKGINLDQLSDADPRAMRALEKLREEWRKAPVNPELNGAAVRIPGFLVPLEKAGERISEFLLVPYFGACIHVPPPPANQIIHVVADPPASKVRAMDAVWVNGVLQASSSNTSMGDASYRMRATSVTPYRP